MSAVQSKKYSDKLINFYGEALLSSGYATLPWVIKEYRRRLGITRKELELIEKVFRLQYMGITRIKDKQLNVDSEFGVEYYRQRKALKRKGYLNYYIDRRYYNNEYRTRGIVYNFNGLVLAVEKMLKELDIEVESSYENEHIAGNAENKAIEINNFDNQIISDSDDKDNSQTSTIEAEKIFLKDFELLYFDVLKERIDFSKCKQYKKYLLKGFRNRNRGFNEAKEDILNMLNEALRGVEEKRRRYVVQDVVCNAMFMSASKERVENLNINDLKIPSGADVLEQFLDDISAGLDVKEAYANAKENRSSSLP